MSIEENYIEAQGGMKTFSYFCIGLGCGMFGHGLGYGSIFLDYFREIKRNIKYSSEI
ncbi:hypothetical protein [Desulfosporosinus orientis]|uniref:hypothetical protein n=1 Tax=Desulfosporosinus orientis TaxID=1563 RepID=UPI00130539E9|nr:hypothetical protein [Desulfosporosinus orientis]